MLIPLLAVGATPARSNPTAPPPAPRAVAVEPPYLEGALLFPEEARDVQLATAAFLAAHGYDVVDREGQYAVYDADRRGVRYPEGTPCAAPSDPVRLFEFVYPNTGAASLDARCGADGACRVDLAAWPAAGAAPRGTVDRWSAPIPAVSLANVLAAVPHLVPAAEAGDGAGGLIAWDQGRRPEPVARTVEAKVSSSVGWSVEEAAARIAAIDFSSCWAGFQRSREAPFVVFSVGAQGAVTRCEATDVLFLPGTEAACACDRIRAVGFGPGADDRRAYVKLESRAPVRRDRAGTSFRVWLDAARSEAHGAPSAEPGIERDSLAAPQVRAVEFGVQYTVAADGTPLRWDVQWPSGVSPRARACVAAQLDAARFDCSFDGAARDIDIPLSVLVTPASP